MLQSSGSGLENVVKITAYLSSMDDFQTFNQIYSNFFGKHFPARTAYEVSRLPMDAKIEIEAIAEIESN